jgi:hypothetical protein
MFTTCSSNVDFPKSVVQIFVLVSLFFARAVTCNLGHRPLSSAQFQARVFGSLVTVPSPSVRPARSTGLILLVFFLPTDFQPTFWSRAPIRLPLDHFVAGSPLLLGLSSSPGVESFLRASSMPAHFQSQQLFFLPSRGRLPSPAFISALWFLHWCWTLERRPPGISVSA